MHMDVANRLVDNLVKGPIGHYQGSWLADHSDIFVVSSTDKWSCATSGCAAGFMFLEEAEPGTVFDSNTECIYKSADAYEEFWMDVQDGEFDPDEDSYERMFDWGIKILGINESQGQFLFMDLSASTEETINKLKFLMRFSDRDVYEYDPFTVY